MDVSADILSAVMVHRMMIVQPSDFDKGIALVGHEAGAGLDMAEDEIACRRRSHPDDRLCSNVPASLDGCHGLGLPFEGLPEPLTVFGSALPSSKIRAVSLDGSLELPKTLN